MSSRATGIPAANPLEDYQEKKSKKEKRLGYLGKKELIEEVRKIFLNASVLRIK